MNEASIEALPELLTQRQTANFLGISPRTLEYYRIAGDGPKWTRIGRRLVRYRKSDVLAYAGIAYE